MKLTSNRLWLVSSFFVCFVIQLVTYGDLQFRFLHSFLRNSEERSSHFFTKISNIKHGVTNINQVDSQQNYGDHNTRLANNNFTSSSNIRAAAVPVKHHMLLVPYEHKKGNYHLHILNMKGKGGINTPTKTSCDVSHSTWSFQEQQPPLGGI